MKSKRSSVYLLVQLGTHTETCRPCGAESNLRESPAAAGYASLHPRLITVASLQDAALASWPLLSDVERLQGRRTVRHIRFRDPHLLLTDTELLPETQQSRRDDWCITTGVTGGEGAGGTGDPRRDSSPHRQPVPKGRHIPAGKSRYRPDTAPPNRHRTTSGDSEVPQGRQVHNRRCNRWGGGPVEPVILAETALHIGSQSRRDDTYLVSPATDRTPHLPSSWLRARQPNYKTFKIIKYSFILFATKTQYTFICNQKPDKSLFIQEKFYLKYNKPNRKNIEN